MPLCSQTQWLELVDFSGSTSPERRNSEFLIAHVALYCEVVGAVGVLYPAGDDAHKIGHGANLGKMLFDTGLCVYLA